MSSWGVAIQSGVSRAWEGVQGAAAAARDSVSGAAHSLKEKAKTALYVPKPQPIAHSIIVNPGTNENPIQLDANFPIRNGGQEHDGRELPFRHWLVLHPMTVKSADVPQGENRPIYWHPVTYEQEQQLIRDGKVPCPGGCATSYAQKGPEQASPYHWGTSVLRWMISAVQEIVVDVFKNLSYIAVIAGVGVYSALLFGSTPLALLLQGPVAGFVVGGIVGTVIISAVAKVVFGAGIGTMKAKDVPFEGREHSRNTKIAIGVITFLASVFISYKAISFSGTRAVGRWIEAGSSARVFNLLDALPSVGDAAAMGFSQEVIQTALQIGFFSLGIFAASLYTWGRKAVVAFGQMRESLQPHQRV